MANVLDCNVVGYEFELHSSYYVQFNTNAPKKGK